VNSVPTRPKIYHITHVENLPRIIQAGGLLSDAAMIQQGGPATAIGMPDIKQRRLTLPIHCHPGLNVGDCVPFNFCPRSVMLFVLDRGNLQGLRYKNGQNPIVHLEVDFAAVVNWANAQGRRWAFSTSNAGAYYTDFYNNLADLGQINWTAVVAVQFGGEANRAIREAKQAEFLIDSPFPWALVERIGVISQARLNQVNAALVAAQHKPRVEVRQNWYF